ncbi:Sulfotransferase family protein [Shimia sp. SK013]|uniref:sulfotransferase family 2 domain-containing protein n=1 Tax=Shimia sp. SK013 TaxID=1389006 RepID=UPI0006CC3F64|nr:sulfotransferase family 2 domain-containing protein [Shimia sp. SK013]KPA23699.1 Sulfotransferase family protein [Shimia sp. SK013]
MTIMLPKEQVSVFTVPKCLSTSLCHLFFEYENGFAADNLTVSGKTIGIHTLYPTGPFRRTSKPSRNRFWRAAIIRDPVSRVVSVYRNRIVEGEILKRKSRIRDLRVFGGLPQEPDLETFVQKLDKYRASHVGVAHHLEPLSFFLGSDPSYFDAIYTLKQVPQFLEDLQSNLDRELPPLRHLMTAGPKITVDDLSESGRRQIEKMYEEDLTLFGPFLDGNSEPQRDTSRRRTMKGKANG